MNKIILIGFMGSGKSSVGKILAKKLKTDFIEMDDLLLKKSECKTISEIFDSGGEIKFRELEIATAKDLSKIGDAAIISTGGGVILNKIILDYLKNDDDVIVFLKTNFDTIATRLTDLDDRPLFKNQTTAKNLFKNRASLYGMYADIKISTDNKTVEEITNEIIERIK